MGVYVIVVCAAAAIIITIGTANLGAEEEEETGGTFRVVLKLNWYLRGGPGIELALFKWIGGPKCSKVMHCVKDRVIS